jgi:CRP/FNR family transcriptional regulator, cyclic AMP receptor protein
MKKSNIFSKKRKILAARILAQKIGYLRTQDFPSFPDMPTQTFNAHRIIRAKDELFVVKNGMVEIWHSHQDMLVTELQQESIFGEMSLLGQTMLGCQAIAGRDGVTLGVMNSNLTKEWIDSNPVAILQELGPHFAFVEAEHYRAAFQTVHSRVAGLLLELAGEASTVEGFIQEELGDRLGAYRETVTNAIGTMKEEGFIEVGRKRITILDKQALQELSNM